MRDTVTDPLYQHASRCMAANNDQQHHWDAHVEAQLRQTVAAIGRAGLTIVPDDSPDAYDLDCEVPLRLDPSAARLDRLDALTAALDDPELLGWRGLPEYAIAYAAAIRDVRAILNP